MFIRIQLAKRNAKNKIFMIFGANSPIGFEIAWELVHLKAQVIVVCRTMEKALETREIISQQLASLYYNKKTQGNLEEKHDRALMVLYQQQLKKSIQERIAVDECDCSDLPKIKDFIMK